MEALGSVYGQTLWAENGWNSTHNPGTQSPRCQLCDTALMPTHRATPLSCLRHPCKQNYSVFVLPFSCHIWSGSMTDFLACYGVVPGDELQSRCHFLHLQSTFFHSWGQTTSVLLYSEQIFPLFLTFATRLESVRNIEKISTRLRKMEMDHHNVNPQIGRRWTTNRDFILMG